MIKGRITKWNLPVVLMGAIILTLFILACGDDDAPTPTAAPAAATVDISAITSDIKQTIQEEVGKIQPPLSEAEIRNLIESAVSTGVPEGVSAGEIQSMVDSAVAAAAAEGVTQTDVTAAIGAAVAAAAAAAPEPLSAMDIERIVKASIPTPAPVAMATATPRPTPAATQAPGIPVSPRLIVAMIPVRDQERMPHLGGRPIMQGLNPMLDWLILQDHTGNYTKNGLANDWTMAPDAKSWNFKLRTDVTFHKGVGGFTAQDVHATATLHMSDTSSHRIGPFRNGVADRDVQIVGDYEINWSTETPFPNLLEFISDSRQMGMMSAKYLADKGEDGYNEDPVSTGPFQFVKYPINEYVLYERIENHWRQTPDFHELQLLFVPESATRLAMILTREVGMADMPRSLHQQAIDRGFSVATSTRPFVQMWGIIGGQYYDDAPSYDPDDPLRNVKVREALNLAIDRQALKDNFLNEKAEIQVMISMAMAHKDYNPRWEPYPYDPDRAKQLLTEAGYPNGFELELQTAVFQSSPELPDMTEAMITYFEAIGVKPNFSVLDRSEFGRLQRERLLGRTVQIWGVPSTPLEVGWLPFGLSSRLGHSVARWEYEELEQMWVDFLQLVDEEERTAQLRRITDFFYDDFLILPLFHLPEQVIYDPEVVAEYSVSMLGYGPTKGHEFTKAVFK
jgi:peptide/nickel transport system substrate-binding protein